MQGWDRLSRITLGQILLLAFVLRLLWAFAVPVHPVSDPSVYDLLAQRLADGQGYSWPDGTKTAYWPVGTSAFYGALYYLIGHNLFVAALCNVVLGTLLVAATHALAITGFDRGVALLSAFLAAIWPTWIALTTVLSSELPANLLVVAGVACALSTRGSATGRVILSSALLAGSTYFRANMLPFILLVPLLVAIRDRRPMQAVTHGVLALLVGALLIAPWAMRNQQAVGKAVPISTNLGVNLWIGNNPEADGGFMAPPPPGPEALPSGEVAQDLVYQRAAKDYIYTHPAKYIALCFRRLVLALDRETYGVAWNDRGVPPIAKGPLKIVMTGYWYLLFLLAVGGLAAFVWRRPAQILSPFVVMPMAIMATPVLVMSSERYHYGIAPFVAVFAASAIARLAASRRVRASAIPARQVKTHG